MAKLGRSTQSAFSILHHPSNWLNYSKCPAGALSRKSWSVDTKPSGSGGWMELWACWELLIMEQLGGWVAAQVVVVARIGIVGWWCFRIISLNPLVVPFQDASIKMLCSTHFFAYLLTNLVPWVAVQVVVMSRISTLGWWCFRNISLSLFMMVNCLQESHLEFN